MPKLRRKALEVLHSAEIRKIAMLGMEMDVSLAYGGDSDSVLGWIVDNQERFVGVDIDRISQPTKPGRGPTLRDEVVPYIKGVQRYLVGEREDLPEWAGDLDENTEIEERPQMENEMSVASPVQTTTVEVSVNDFPTHWLTKKGTPDKRKAAVRAVLDDGLTIEQALEMEAEVKYIPKKVKAAETEVNEEVPVEPQEEVGAQEDSYEEVVSSVVETKKVAFKKGGFGKTKVEKPAQAGPPPAEKFDDLIGGVAMDTRDLLQDFKRVFERMDYFSKALSDIKQQTYENKSTLDSLSRRVVFIENALLFLINSAVLEDTQVDTLESIPQPSEY